MADLVAPQPGDAGGGAVPDEFEALANRSAVIYLIRNTQQHLVSLSAQADLKANIIITASSLLLTIGVTKLQEPALRTTVAILAAGCLSALVLAILAVLPDSTRRGAPRSTNPLFFADMAKMTTEEYLDALARVAHTDASLYRAQAEDLHHFGTFLAVSKYPRLRRAYVAFLSGLVLATLHQMAVAFF